MQKDLKGQRPTKMYSITEKGPKMICVRQAQPTATNHTGC